MIWFEIIAVVSTILCVILSVSENIWVWPVGIISVLALIAIYVPNGMYAQIILQGVFLIQSIIGWYNWGKKDGAVINRLPKTKFASQTIFIISLGSTFAFTNRDNYLFTMLDGISTALALLGNWYLVKKTIQCWPLFMSYNVILVGLLFYQGIYLLGIMNIALFFISFNGFYTWKRNLRGV